MVTAASMRPKKKPAIVFPKTIVNNETGATSNLSKVPVCFSKTTATASMEVVPKSIDKRRKPSHYQNWTYVASHTKRYE